MREILQSLFFVSASAGTPGLDTVKGVVENRKEELGDVGEVYWDTVVLTSHPTTVGELRHLFGAEDATEDDVASLVTFTASVEAERLEDADGNT